MYCKGLVIDFWEYSHIGGYSKIYHISFNV